VVVSPATPGGKSLRVKGKRKIQLNELKIMEELRGEQEERMRRYLGDELYNWINFTARKKECSRILKNRDRHNGEIEK